MVAASPAPNTVTTRSILPKSLDVLNVYISREARAAVDRHTANASTYCASPRIVYFEFFYHQLPILHLPTFSMQEARPLLIASMIGIGACFCEVQGSKDFAVSLFDRIRFILNADFERDAANVGSLVGKLFSKYPEYSTTSQLRSVSLLQVHLFVIIGGLFAGNKRTYELAEASRGTLTDVSIAAV